MKILLVHPPISLKESYGSLYKAAGVTLPIGLASIAAVAKKSGEEVSVIDALVSGQGLVEIAQEIKRINPDVLGITSMTTFAQSAYKLAELSKEVSPNTKIVFGGPHISTFPEQVFLDSKHIDFGVIGEGEVTFLELLKTFKNKETNFSGIRGLIYRKNKEVILTGERERIANLDEVPFPEYSLFPMPKYRPSVSKYISLPTYAIVVSRGCPYRCGFCSRDVFGKKIYTRSPEKVVEEILLLKEKYGAKGIIFQDSTFLVNKKFARGVCELLIKEKIKIRWNCSARANEVDEETLSLMKKAGCWQIGYGLESGVQRLLDIMHKDITLEQAKKAVTLTKKAGIQVRAFFILGLPGESLEDSYATIDFAKDLAPDIATFQLFTPFPGTYLYEVCKNFGTLKTDLKWEDFDPLGVKKTFVYLPEGITQEKITNLVKDAYKSFYFSPHIIALQLKNMCSFTNLKRYFNAFVALLNLK